jgi:hypothetical protein
MKFEVFAAWTMDDTTPRPKHALGALEQLPLEIINMVLAQLDIRSLTDFRWVNQRAL